MNGFAAGVYRHYKGNFYLALGLAQNEDEPDYFVVYVRLYAKDARGGPPLRVRRLSEWRQRVLLGTDEPAPAPGWPDVPEFLWPGVPRFTYVGTEEIL